MVARRAACDDRNQDPDGAALDYAHAGPDNADADGHADGHADADEVGVPGRHATPDRRTDGIAVRDRGADSLSR
ncbi:MAG: hypothetical protein ACRD0H_00505, partial [Actinomycetes bacterium]